MQEFALIEAIAAVMKNRSSRMVRWIGDDAAVVSNRGGVSVTSVDISTEDVHFRRSYFSPAEIGHRALAVALSDLAAMGACAEEAYLALTVPEGVDSDYLLELCRGADALAERFGVTVAGGDISRGTVLTAVVTVNGWAESAEQLVGRDGAKPGDLVAVSGPLGGAGAGLADLEGKAKAPANLVAAHRQPEPRLAVGATLAKLGVSAMIDISDGLAGDAAHIAGRSGVGLQIALNRVPVAEGVVGVARQLDRDPFQFAATAGEDYELCFCTAPQHRAAIERALPEVAWIGRVTAEREGVVFLDENGNQKSLLGFEHRI